MKFEPDAEIGQISSDFERGRFAKVSNRNGYGKRFCVVAVRIIAVHITQGFEYEVCFAERLLFVVFRPSQRKTTKESIESLRSLRLCGEQEMCP